MISSHHVNSWFECGKKCLDRREDCVSFSHRTTSSDDINCRIASESDEIVIKNPHEVDTWTTYELREIISVSTCTAVLNMRIISTDIGCTCILSSGPISEVLETLRFIYTI